MPEPSPRTAAFLESLLGPLDDHGSDEEIDLSKHDASTWDEIHGSKVLPTAAIRRYLDSGDVLTTYAIDKMELALETVYSVDWPWFITSHREGSEAAGDLALRYFYLSKEPV